MSVSMIVDAVEDTAAILNSVAKVSEDGVAGELRSPTTTDICPGFDGHVYV